MIHAKLKGRLVDIEVTDDADGSFCPGYVIAESPTLICIRRFCDFFLDGYEVLKKTRLHAIRTTASNRFIENVVKAERLIEESKKLQSIDISTEDAFLEDVVRRKLPLAAYWADGSKTACLTLGFVTDVGSQTFDMLAISSTGTLGKRIKRLKRSAIYGYMYGDRYTTLYGKYVQK